MVGKTGVLVEVPVRPKKKPLVRDHALARRNHLWLHATTKGIHDPITGRVRCYSVSELAGLWSVAERTVWHGILEAKRLREAIHERREPAE